MGVFVYMMTMCSEREREAHLLCIVQAQVAEVFGFQDFNPLAPPRPYSSLVVLPFHNGERRILAQNVRSHLDN